MRNLINDNPAKLWDFTSLNTCFGRTGIKVSDIDGIVERKGHFLLIETKHPGEAMGKGQVLLFAAFARQGHTALVVTGRSLEDYDKVERIDADGNRHEEDRSLAEVVAAWFLYANSTPDPYTVAQRQINRSATISMIDLGHENETLRKENAELKRKINARRRPKVQVSFLNQIA